MEYHKIPKENLIVIYDDVSLPVGKVRARKKGSAGGHNGIKDIIYQIESDEFSRIKIGVGSPDHEDYELKDYVLGKFAKDEIIVMKESLDMAQKITETFLLSGIDLAMSKYSR